MLNLLMIPSVLVLACSAMSAAQYAITSSTIDSGCGTLTGATYTLSGTIGQADPGVLAGESYSLNGGFWPTTPAAPLAACEGDAKNDGAVDVNDVSRVLFRLGEAC